MRTFLLRAAPLAFPLATGLFVSGPSASGQEAVGARPVEAAPPVVTTYPQTHVDIPPTISVTPPPSLSGSMGNTPSCCGGTSVGTAEGSTGGEAVAPASPADNDALAGSVVDTMIGELPVAAKQRGAE